MLLHTFLVLLLMLHDTLQTNVLNPNDPSSFSRPDLVKVKHMNIVLKANFEEKTFSGYVQLSVEKVVKTVDKLVLDTHDLQINSVTDRGTRSNLKYEVINNEKYKKIGSQMLINLPAGNRFVIKIQYQTSPTAGGLQWLRPEQTVGKIHPYLFSQFEYIEARSFVPCQDTPSYKITFEARISAPKPLKVLMSALEDRKPVHCGNTTTYFYKQLIPVPSYLIAIAIGAFKARKIGPRSTVYSEEEVINAAAYEFANTETQLRTAEDICGPYIWGKADLLVLPSSFPYGGMENPSLTFLTPTILAGDRSLAYLVGHEISHSWTGNLVTNYNFEHAWLNEGFTTFLERKLIGSMNGKQAEDFSAYDGLTYLKDTIKEMGDSQFTKLIYNLTGIHPDDNWSNVSYEKGYIFLRYLEDLVGGPKIFEAFLRSYFDTFKFKSITTDDFKQFFLHYFNENQATKEIDWQTWLYQPGMPPVVPDYDLTLLDLVNEKKDAYLKWDENSNDTFPINSSELTLVQKVQLIKDIYNSGPQPIGKLQIWDRDWNMSTIQNVRIKNIWLRIGIMSRWKKIVPAALDFVTETGRMIFIRPIYRDLYEWENVRTRAIETFNKNKQNMMLVAVEGVQQDLHLI